MESFNAKTLMDRMQSIDKSDVDSKQKLIAIMKKYVDNYNRLFILNTITRGNVELQKKIDNIDLSDMINILESMRTFLTVSAPSITHMACVTLRANNYNFAYIYFISSDITLPIFISIGGNVISSDGEWRPHICDNGAYKLLIGRHVKTIEKIIDKIGVPDITSAIFYSSDMKVVEDKIYNVIDVEKYNIYMYALAVLSGKHDHIKDLSPDFATFLENVPALPKIDDTTAADMLNLLGSCTGITYSNPFLPTQYNIVRTGQKFILLTASAVSRPFNALEYEWNELMTIRETTDLVLNMISPCFAIYAAWFFVYNANKSLFNVHKMREKIMMSDSIRMTDGDTRGNSILSDIVINVISENVGRTFISDFPLSNIERYIFDILFALLSMNTKLNKMHCDLHGNNVTILKRSDISGVIIYEINGARYVLPHTGAYACIIDFSRSINFYNINIVDIMIVKYEMHFPEWTKKNMDALMSRAINALDGDIITFMKIVSAFDIFDLCSSLLANCPNIDHAASFLTTCKNEAANILFSILDIQAATYWANAILINKLFSPHHEWWRMEKKICGYYADTNELKYSIAQFSSLPPPLKTAPIIAHKGDEPVDTNAMLTSIINSNYQIQTAEEGVLHQLGV